MSGVHKAQRKRRGRIKKSKARNLLERLRDYENDSLRFIDDERITFSNDLGENDIQITKVQQKISGCFRSDEEAVIFYRIRNYLPICRKKGIKPTAA